MINTLFLFYVTLEKLNTGAGNFMCSFYVNSLFANVPLDDTTEICINALYHPEHSVPPTVEGSVSRKLLMKASTEVQFSFADRVFSQVDCTAIYSQRGRTVADI